jgi:hypothetical protein
LVIWNYYNITFLKGVTMLMIEAKEMSDAEFETSLPKIEAILLSLSERLKELAQLFSRMSRPQLREVKKRFGRMIGEDRIERLVMMGRGLLSEHLGLREKCVSAGKLRVMPPEVLAQIGNPEFTHPVLVPGKGVIPKAVKNMSAFELNQILDPQQGKLRTATEQKKLLMEQFHVVPKAAGSEPRDDEQGLLVHDAKFIDLDKGKLLVTANNGGQVVLLRSDLERWFGIKA